MVLNALFTFPRFFNNEIITQVILMGQRILHLNFIFYSVLSVIKNPVFRFP